MFRDVQYLAQFSQYKQFFSYRCGHTVEAAALARDFYINQILGDIILYDHGKRNTVQDFGFSYTTDF